MARYTIDTDYVLDRMNLEKYGIGIPFLFFSIGVYLLYVAVPGLAILSSLTAYGKLGLGVVLALTAFSFVLAGITYQEISKTDLGLLTKEHDGPGADRVE